MRNKSTAKELGRGDLTNVTTYQAGVMQASAHRLLQKHCDEILKPYGITKTHWIIIGIILDAGESGIRITDLSKKTGTTLSYLTNTINLLESKKILKRVSHKQDNRSKFVKVQPTFIKKCDEIELFLREKLRSSIYSEVSVKDFHTYMKVLYQLTKVG